MGIKESGRQRERNTMKESGRPTELGLANLEGKRRGGQKGEKEEKRKEEQTNEGC